VLLTVHRSHYGRAPGTLVLRYRNVLSDTDLQDVAGSLVEVPGVTAVMLGGSRARGAAFPDSDVDLGLYYRPPLDLARLRRLAEAVGVARAGSGRPELTEPGAWGPWVDGGGWLTIDGVSVDWIYRDVDRVQRSWQLAESGTFSFHFQVGHPFGVPDFAYAGEVALGVLLADPTGELTQLKEQMITYPPKLGRAIVDRLAEARFLLDHLPKSAQRRDVAFVAGCLFRVIGLCAHAIHATAGRWVITEKGLIDAAGKLPDAPVAFSQRADEILGSLGADPAGLRKAIASAGGLLADVATAVTRNWFGAGNTANETG
jgi:hypothetical protein